VAKITSWYLWTFLCDIFVNDDVALTHSGLFYFIQFFVLSLPQYILRTLSFGTLLMVLRGRSTRSTLSDFIVLKFFPAPLFLQIHIQHFSHSPCQCASLSFSLCISIAQLCRVQYCTPNELPVSVLLWALCRSLGRRHFRYNRSLNDSYHC